MFLVSIAYFKFWGFLDGSGIFLMFFVSVSSVKSWLFEGHSKVFNFSTDSAKYLLKDLAISSLLFTNKVSLPAFSFVLISKDFEFLMSLNY